MRLSVFIAEQTSPQLIIDLQKIYSGLLATEILNNQNVQKLLLEPYTRLFMTMFNERHIGAVKVVVEAHKAVLSQLCIREITRRRGVGKNLLKQVEVQLTSEAINELEYNLEEVNESERVTTQMFLKECGYTIKECIATKKIS